MILATTKPLGKSSHRAKAGSGWEGPKGMLGYCVPIVVHWEWPTGMVLCVCGAGDWVYSLRDVKHVPTPEFYHIHKASSHFSDL